jgi:hypothetical protein
VPIRAIFGESLRVFRDALPSLVAAVLVFSLPLQLAVEYFVYHHVDAEAAGGLMGLYAALYVILMPFLAAAGILAARAVVDGPALDATGLLRASARRWPKLLEVQIPAGILVTLGFLALLVPGLVLTARWALLECVALFEGRGPGACRTRSAELVKGSTGAVLGLFLLLHLPGLSVSFAGGFLMGVHPPLDHFAFSAVASSATDLVDMLAWIGLFLLYRRWTGPPDAMPVLERPAPIA